MPHVRARTPEELAAAMHTIRANSARFLAHATSTRARWEKFRDEIEAQDRLVRMLREAAARDASYRNFVSNKTKPRKPAQ